MLSLGSSMFDETFQLIKVMFKWSFFNFTFSLCDDDDSKVK